MEVGLEREQQHGTARGGIKFLRMAIFLQREAKIWKTEGLATHVATNEFSPVYLLKPWKLNIHYEIVCILRPFMLTKVQKDAMPGV